MDQSQSHRFVLLAGDGIFNARFQYLAAIDDLPDLRDSSERGILLERVPVAVEGDQAGFVLRYILVMLRDRVLSTSRFSTTVTRSKVSI